MTAPASIKPDRPPRTSSTPALNHQLTTPSCYSPQLYNGLFKRKIWRIWIHHEHEIQPWPFPSWLLQPERLPWNFSTHSATHILPSFTGISKTYWIFYTAQYLPATQHLCKNPFCQDLHPKSPYWPLTWWSHINCRSFTQTSSVNWTRSFTWIWFFNWPRSIYWTKSFNRTGLFYRTRSSNQTLSFNQKRPFNQTWSSNRTRICYWSRSFTYSRSFNQTRYLNHTFNKTRFCNWSRSFN